MESGFGALMGLGMGVMLGAIVIGVLVGALVLMLATKLVEKFTPSYGQALLVTLACLGAVFVVNLVLGLIGFAGGMGGFAGGFFAPRRLLVLVADFLVGAWVIQQLLKLPSGERMAYGRACLITLVQYAIGIAIGIAFGLVFGVLLGGMFAAMHH